DGDGVLVLAEVADGDLDVREDAGLFTGVERVVDRLAHRREQRLRRVVEAEQVPVLREELADRDLALPGGHGDRVFPLLLCRHGPSSAPSWAPWARRY